MEYILMRHANDDGLEREYDQVRDLARRNGVTLDNASILERMASLAVDSRDAYVHDEVIEIARQRDERFQQHLRESPGLVRAPNVFAETVQRLNQRVAGRPLTIAYNDALRTEFTARAVARITGGNLVVGELEEAEQVYQWMENHASGEGLIMIITHEPAIKGLLGIWGKVGYSSAYSVGRIENGRGRDVQQI